MTTPTTILLSIMIAVVVYQRLEIACLRRDHAWGLGTQGAWRWRLRSRLALLALIWPVDVVHFDIDLLKTLNRELGEPRVNELLRRAFRRGDLYRLQHGDECVAIAAAGRGRALAEALAARCAALHLTEAERAAIGGGITLTTVVAPRVRRVGPAVERAVTAREFLKAAGQRNHIAVL